MMYVPPERHLIGYIAYNERLSFVCKLDNLTQRLLQWDGKQTKAIYRLTDLLMEHNLVGKVKEQHQMETELKAIIYQYMYRMVKNKL